MYSTSAILDAALDRVRSLIERKADSAVCDALGVSRSSIPTWRRRGTFPAGAFVAFAESRNISLDWLILGRGPLDLTEKQTPGPDLYAQVRAGFVSQGTSLHRWCLNNKITRQHATLALLGGWRGPESKALLGRILKAAGVEPQEHTPLGELATCSNCLGDEPLEVSHELLANRFVVWCGCGNDSGAHRQLRAAINAWNRRNT